MSLILLTTIVSRLISAESVVHVNPPNIQSRNKKVESRKKQKLISRAREASGIDFNIAKRTLIPPYSFFDDPILFFFYSTVYFACKWSLQGTKYGGARFLK